MPTDEMFKVSVTAPLHTEAAALASVANILSLPDEADRQPDLQYLTAIFVSSGMNKNGAVFLGSELVKARNTIDKKAVDIEHEEQSIIGQITGSAFLKRDRTSIDVEKAALEMSEEEMDELEMDVGITAIIHKARFPRIAEEIEAGEWMVSMECYYRSYDVKVGDMVIPREKAEEMGYDKLVGTVVQVKDGNKELGFHLVGRVLRDILFAGVGIVQTPANARSIIMEAAAINNFVEQEAAVQGETSTVLDISLLNLEEASEASTDNNSVTLDFIKETITTAIKDALTVEDTSKEESHVRDMPSKPGTCLSYAKHVYTYPKDLLEDPETDLSQYPAYSVPGVGVLVSPSAQVSREHYCKLFDADCTARPGDATKFECLRNAFSRVVVSEVAAHDKSVQVKRIQEKVISLSKLVDDAKKFVD